MRSGKRRRKRERRRRERGRRGNRIEIEMGIGGGEERIDIHSRYEIDWIIDIDGDRSMCS